MNTRSLLHSATAAAAAAALVCGGNASYAGAPTTAPQVLLAITNSESMDGTTGGAIMVGSGALGSGSSSLSSSSSPTNYTVPTGFVAPISGTVAGGSAPYTSKCSATSGALCDNGPSRLNFTKAAITSVLGTYGSSLNFGLYTYQTGTPTLYSTWVYYMSNGSSNFSFTNTSSTTAPVTVANPCYNYSSASTDVSSACGQIATAYSAGFVSGNKYMTIGASSDDPQINDVLYDSPGGIQPDMLTYSGVTPSNPYTHYSLTTYNRNIGSYSVAYGATLPAVSGTWQTTPTNAGYVPFSSQVLYSARGFGYGASQNATTGNPMVAMGTDPTSSSFTAALAPETNVAGTGEIKSVAGQSGIYALMNGANTYLSGLAAAAAAAAPTVCPPGQYVVLLTDGLPTLDHNGYAWPPLGTATASAYSLTATFNTDGSFATSNSDAVNDAMSAITALYNASGTTHVKVYVIGLGAGVDATVNPSAANLLQAMAIAGGTGHYQAANSAADLTTAFATIVDAIYRDSAIAAPVAPISVAGGASYEYELTTIASPTSGHVQAFAVSSAGVPSTTASWDAASLMTVAQRSSGSAALIAPNSAGTGMTPLGSLDAAAFALSAGAAPCVPDVNTIVQYTINPNYSGACTSYLAGRDPTVLLGGFSTQNSGRYVPPPSSTMLAQTYPSYVTFATAAAQTSRTPMLMFTDEDGFLYAVDASTATTAGNTLWGWTTRNLVAKLQNYKTFATSGASDGGFAAVDAYNGTTWATYVVGSFQSGAEHYSVKLDASGKPTTMVYDSVVAAGSSAGDKAVGTGLAPLRQTPVIAYIGLNAYAIYVVNVGSVSTLYETNVATGVSTSAVLTSPSPSSLALSVTSALTLDASSNQLYFGATDSAGNNSVWVLGLTNAAATDITHLQKIGTTVVPSTGAASTPILYVSNVSIGGIPYVFAANSAQLTFFGIASTGWVPLWTTTTAQGYTYNGTSYVSSTSVTTLTAGSVISDVPTLLGTALIVPVYVAPASVCSLGTGDYDFFNVVNGTFPPLTGVTIGGVAITADLAVGSGPAFSPSVTLTKGGIALGPASKGGSGTGGSPPVPSTKPILAGAGTASKFISWRQH